MKKQVYISIVVLIVLSLLGIIAAQAVWMIHQYEHQTHRFHQDVKKSMSELSSTIASKELFGMKEIIANIDFGKKNIKIDIRKDTLDRVMIIKSQSFEELKDGEVTSFDFEEVEIHPRDALHEFRRASNFKLPINPNGESISEKYALDSLLQEKLAENSIDIPFEYGLFDSYSKDMIKKSEGAEEAKLRDSHFRAFFRSHKELLKIYFPSQAQVIFHRMGRQLLLSGLLVLLVALSFLYALSIILKQKRHSEITTDFINNMTHEFKTPIATISFALANIENPKILENKEKILELTSIIRAENQRMDHQVEQVLRASISDQNTFNLKPEVLNFHELINFQCKKAELRVQAKGGVIRRELNAGYALVYGDRLHLSNLLSNILDNAIKYSPNKIEIEVLTWNDADGFYFSVTDQGIGMNKETQKKIFDKFYRVPTGDLHNVKGFGLGLNYAQSVALQHQGQIRVSSSLGKGSTFVVFLPLSSNENKK